MKSWLLLWILVWNGIAFVLMGLDKGRAKGQKWRIPEKVLFLSAALGQIDPAGGAVFQGTGDLLGSRHLFGGLQIGEHLAPLPFPGRSDRPHSSILPIFRGK